LTPSREETERDRERERKREKEREKERELEGQVDFNLSVTQGRVCSGKFRLRYVFFYTTREYGDDSVTVELHFSAL